MCYVLIWSTFLYILAGSASSLSNNTGLMISSYSRGSHWNNIGKNDSLSKSEGRSNSGQMFYTQSSDAKITRGQNLQRKNSSGVYDPGNTLSINKKQNDFSRIGEIQERFNPRPYFDYEPVSAPTKDTKQSISYEKPFETFPASAPPTKEQFDSKLSNIYDSPYTSYNPPPPPSKAEDDKEFPTGYPAKDEFRPTVDYNQEVYDTPPPPLLPNEMKKPKENMKLKQTIPYPPSSSEQDNPLKYMNDFSQENFEMDPETVQTVPPPNSADVPSYIDYLPYKENQHIQDFSEEEQIPKHHKHHHHYKPKPDEISDDDSKSFPLIENYNKMPHLYSQDIHDVSYDYDHHHVYHEIEHTTTTTTEAPAEDERVNKGQYSYYYLGRKLWYIPLYFSVYFIVYITVLILKSIARHKVSFVQHFDNKRTSRNFDINDMHKNVNQAFDNVQRKYMM